MLKIYCVGILILLSFLLGSSCEERFSDNARIYRSHIEKVVFPTTETDLQDLIKDARARHVPLIAAGKHHSQGGQSFRENGIVVDMTRFNKIVELNVANKWIIVQSGTSWEKIQEAINGHGLAVKVMQSSNIFTVGGSLSVNAHGRDPRFSSLSSTVQAIKFLSADGHSRWIDREHEADLFHLVVGGYGLFGFILEVKISLIDNLLLDKSVTETNPENYLDFFNRHIKNDDQVNLHFARFYTGVDAPLSKMLAVTYKSRTPRQVVTTPLAKESNVALNKFYLSLLRGTEWAKKTAWRYQLKQEYKPEVVSRNNAMRPPILALDYYSSRDTDILQEYYIPVEKMASFTHDIQRVMKHHKLNLLNITLRYIRKNMDSVLPYAQTDCFAFVFYVNVGLSDPDQEEVANWTRKLIDAAQSYKGSFYLTYQRYATPNQLLSTYPNLRYFLEQKRVYDPEQLFQSDFYRYLLLVD